MKRKIIWLEDKPDDYKDIQKLIEKKFEIVACEDLSEFKNAVDAHLVEPKAIAGFMIDVLIKVDSLEQLDLANVYTRKGVETGIKVVAEYLRNFNNNSQCVNVAKAYSSTPILILSSMVSLKTRYAGLCQYDNSEIEMITKYAPKYIQADWLKDLKSWLNSL